MTSTMCVLMVLMRDQKGRGGAPLRRGGCSCLSGGEAVGWEELFDGCVADCETVQRGFIMFIELCISKLI